MVLYSGTRVYQNNRLISINNIEKMESFKFKNNRYLDSTSIVHNHKKLNEILDDTGWIKLNLINGATIWTQGREPCYRRIGNRVYLSGLFKAPASNSVLPISYLPEGFRPHYDYESFIIRNGSSYCICGVNQDNRNGAIWIQFSKAGETSLSNVSFLVD